MLIISKKAEIYISTLLKKEKENTYIRIFVLYPGTYKAECGLSYFSYQERINDDILLYCNYFSIFTERKNIIYLKNAKIDLITNDFQRELTLDAPNIKRKCPDPSSSLVEKLEYFLESEINFELSKHGGSVSLIKLTKDNYVHLEFLGGCNGCSMSNQTLKEGIEKRILREFHEISGVIDDTKHHRGIHSYF